jgi:hypothetical protein
MKKREHLHLPPSDVKKEENTHKNKCVLLNSNHTDINDVKKRVIPKMPQSDRNEK